MALVCLVTTGTSLSGQTEASPRPAGPAIPYVETFDFDGDVSEWRAYPVPTILDADGSRPQVLVWLGQVDQGLVVAGELRSPAAPARRPPALRVSLAGSQPPEMPPVGWGHQFGFEVLADSTSCEDLEQAFGVPGGCVGWYRRQLTHRERLQGLFERSWRIVPDGPSSPREVGATPVFERLPDADRLAALAPGGRVRALTGEIFGTQGGVGFELLIPWSAFPPVQAPNLDAVRLEVAWERPTMVAGDPGRSIPVSPLLGAAARPLARPIAHHVTPCRAGLSGVLIPGTTDRRPRVASDGAVVFMKPNASGDLRRLVVIDNHAEGYQYTPSRGTLSPQAFETEFDVLDLGGGLRLCTPNLALGNDQVRLTPPDWTTTGEGDPWGRFADLRDLQIRRQDDGDLLVISGPKVFWSYYGSGQCGACPRVSVEIFRIDTNTGEIRTVLRHSEIAEPGTRDVEIEVTQDWGRVTVFKSETLWDASPIEVRWSATRFCSIEAQGRTSNYEVCGHEDDVAEPAVRLRARYAER